jgi:2-iminobutanoate/2-iminopropanoate deaminase
MTIREIKTPKASLPVGPYSQAIEVKNMVFISGLIPLDPSNQEIIRNDISTATSTIFSNLNAILQAADLKKNNIAKVTIYLKNIRDFEKVNSVYGDYFKDAPVFPARSTVQVSALPKDADIEMDFIAVR